ncbi:OmpA family protein [Malikia sp.]|uniref:OmpA family protein n=1 Tax=Malikia sp. TaxID=2070706 RepID=UPI0026293E81|nr:OmpA family protein [Malikia sp.]MDD2727847.1 OmpA family protein [Malikia sp.]
MTRRRRNRRQDDDTDSAERWLVSYADFITLLFAFFVVMYALSLQGGQYQDLSESFDQATSKGKAPAKPDSQASSAAVAPTDAPPPPDEMQQIAEQLAKRLAITLQQGAAQVRHLPQAIHIDFDAGILFPPAEANLSPSVLQALRSVADVLQAYPQHTIQVVGHTDTLDIRSAQYPSNWELSAARASSVVRLFVESGIADRRLVAIGRGATQPVASNADPEGRLRNRRVEIQILPASPPTTAGASVP